MTGNSQNSLSRLWTPVGLQADEPRLAFVRVKLVSSLIIVFSMVFLPAAFLAALFLHNRSLGAAGISILAINTMSMGVLEGSRIWLVLRIGRWTGWNREPIGRHDRPVHFWVRTAMHTATAAISAGGGVFLGLIGFELVMRR